MEGGEPVINNFKYGKQSKMVPDGKKKILFSSSISLQELKRF
jgi:hypothetical protein